MFDSPSDDDANTVFRDVILLTLAGFIVIVIMLIPHINPQGIDNDEAIKSLGNLSVEIFWPDNYDTDVNVWVKAPEQRAVGYSNKTSKYLDLVRDDLGKINDPMPFNYENVFSRGIVPGEYVVNLHLYSDRSNQLPVPVKVVVTKQNDARGNKSSKVERIFMATVPLTETGQEKTVVRFSMDADGDLVKDSIHDTPVAIR